MGSIPMLPSRNLEDVRLCARLTRDWGKKNAEQTDRSNTSDKVCWTKGIDVGQPRH